MKTCPQCGYVERKSDRQLLRLYRVHFGALPVWDMLRRGWITVIDRESVSEIRAEIMRFFDIKDDVVLDGFLRGELVPVLRGGYRVCELPPSPFAKPDPHPQPSLLPA